MVSNILYCDGHNRWIRQGNIRSKASTIIYTPKMSLLLEVVSMSPRIQPIGRRLTAHSDAVGTTRADSRR